MDAQTMAIDPGAETLHCRDCKATHPCTIDDLDGYLIDDSTWPRCCGLRMTTILPERIDVEADDPQQ